VSGPRGSIAMALALAIMGIGATAGLVAVTRAMSPSQPTPPPPPPVAPPAPTVPHVSTGPIAFRDPDNAQRWLVLRPKVDKAKEATAAFEKATTIPNDDLEESCAKIFEDANPLAGEPHTEVQKYADNAKRLCDYDRSLSLLRLVTRIQKASPAKSKGDKRARCDFAARSVKRLVDRGYGDDEKAKTEMAEVGKACL